MDQTPPAVPAWEQRFRAAYLVQPSWAEQAPDRTVFTCNSTGTYEVYAWDRASQAEPRQVTDRPNGTFGGALTPDGAWIWWFDDTDGDEFGVWRRQPFGGGADVEAAPGVAPAYPSGLALGQDGLAVVGTSTDDGSAIHLVREGHAPVRLYQDKRDAHVADVDVDNTLVAIGHSEHGDPRHQALRVLRLPTEAGDGVETVAELWDGAGKGLLGLGFAPVPGDTRLLVLHERYGRWAPLVWEPVSGEQWEIGLDLPGEVGAGWYPDGSGLLIRHSHQARSELYRYNLHTGQLEPVPTDRGTIRSAGVRPDGSVEYLYSAHSTPPQLRSTTGATVLAPPGPTPPGSVELTDAWVDGPGGPIHALVATPTGQSGPHPTVFLVHGGPEAHDTDAFSPGSAAWVDHGFAVVKVNYRGSTGYGQAWRDALAASGEVGLTELADIVAVREWAVAGGLTDPARTVLAGASWGGYLTLLGLGVHPELWTVGVAGVPVADYLTAYQDEMEDLRSYDRALFGGSPEEVPDKYRRSSPISYLDQVRAPVFISAGENDPRCPIRQIENYVTGLAERGIDHQLYRYAAGHSALVTEERITLFRAELAFALERLPDQPA